MCGVLRVVHDLERREDEDGLLLCLGELRDFCGVQAGGGRGEELELLADDVGDGERGGDASVVGDPVGELVGSVLRRRRGVVRGKGSRS